MGQQNESSESKSRETGSVGIGIAFGFLFGMMLGNIAGATLAACRAALDFRTGI
jgi:hypothetical protein